MTFLSRQKILFSNNMAKTIIMLIRSLLLLTLMSSVLSIGGFLDYYLLPKWLFCLFFLNLSFICIIILKLWVPLKLSPKKFEEKIISYYKLVSIILCVGSLFHIFILKTWVSLGSPIFTYDNTAGLCATICPITPFFLKDLNKNFYYNSICILLVFTVLIVTKSRAGFIATIIPLLFFVVQRSKTTFKGLPLIIILILLTSILSLFIFKKDSTIGRLYIWFITIRMIQRGPLDGYGFAGFRKNYMNFQADFFKNNIDSQFSIIADNSKTAFNEYLELIVVFGIWGIFFLCFLLFAFIYIYRNSTSKNKKILLLSIISIMILSSFSYPFDYPFTWLITFANIMALLKGIPLVPDRVRLKKLVFKRGVFYIFLFIHGSMVPYICYKISCEIQLKHAFYTNDLTEIEKLNIVFCDNPYFHYHKFIIYFRNQDFKKATNSLLICKKKWADYNIMLFLGYTYIQQHKFKKAYSILKTAHYMCPSRFYPLYFMALISKERKDEDLFNILSNEILNKKIKIYSNDIMLIRYNIRKIKTEKDIRDLWEKFQIKIL